MQVLSASMTKAIGLWLALSFYILLYRPILIFWSFPERRILHYVLQFCTRMFPSNKDSGVFSFFDYRNGVLPQSFKQCDLLWAFFEQVQDPLSCEFGLVVPRDYSAAIDVKGSLIAKYTLLVMPCQSITIYACYLAKSLVCGFVFLKKKIKNIINY